MRIDGLRASGFPDSCPGCGGRPEDGLTILVPTALRRLAPAPVIGFPACKRCARKEQTYPLAALAVGLIPFLLGMLLAGHVDDPDLELALGMGIFAGVFIGPIAFAVTAECTRMIRLHDWDRYSPEPDWVEVSVRYPGYAAAPRRDPRRN